MARIRVSLWLFEVFPVVDLVKGPLGCWSKAGIVRGAGIFGKIHYEYLEQAVSLQRAAKLLELLFIQLSHRQTQLTGVAAEQTHGGLHGNWIG